MNYRVLIGYKAYPFSSYSEALLFKNANGGEIFQLEYTCYYDGE